MSRKYGLAKHMQVTLYQNGAQVDVGHIANIDDEGGVLHVKGSLRDYHFLFWEKGEVMFKNATHTFKEDGWREVDIISSTETLLYGDVLCELVPLQTQ